MNRNCRLVAQTLTKSLQILTWIMLNIGFSYAKKKQSLYMQIFRIRNSKADALLMAVT